MQEEIVLTNSFFNGANLFLCFTLISISFSLYGWKRKSFFNVIKQNKNITNALRAFILSLAGCGVFLTLYFVFDSLEGVKNGKVMISILLPSISLSVIVLLLSLAAFFLITPTKIK